MDFYRKTVFVRKQKGKFDHYIPLSDHLIRGLRKYISSDHPQECVFNPQVSKDGAARPITVSAIHWLIKECRSKMDTHKKFTAHTLRHTFATHLLEDGMNIMSVKELLGHARIETTLIYLHVVDVGSSVKYSPLDTLYKD